MKKNTLSLIVMASVFVSILSINSCNSILEVSKIETNRAFNTRTNNKVQFSIIETGTAKTQKAFAFKGGSLFENLKIAHISVWVKHPNGDFLFDTGLGDSINIQFDKGMSFFHKLMFKYKKGQSVKEQLLLNGLNNNSIRTIILSHLHWDHASGINDFPNSDIYTTEEELKFAQSNKAFSPAFIKSQYNNKSTKWKFLNFEKNKYEFFEESCDFFGDGSVIFVKLPGHTLGSIGMFINGQKRYFFTGDVTWAIEGFKRPSSKNRIPSKLVDYDKNKLDTTIIKIHTLMKLDTNLVVIPAHDFEIQKTLKHFPEFQY
ncbi:MULTISPECIES: MBL fold metallo-hydrolase [Flavobacterium]|uniref:Metallo-beta-lactamase domain-containing protein n=1 Tax=Flavobacterium tructae TaxID=1114873 RepID=A0A1S1JC85_9FLAO|nr:MULTISPECIES: MBL fold metallo-hydrolase [Flavobacterium]MDL2145486.1 MBL fold metallo-hydrolase [Flavobacterium tructae]OHT47065.1 hypothetical protein BHE19_21775 [Flavobacterium tructae]OXB15748.1 hypothetical protein B0A71_20215 [Flavobacterium tructae]GIQ61253.1 MBL fold metallo-hydrolase [Flavobacterium collinsii]